MTKLAEKQLGEVASFVRGITFKPDDVVPVGTAGSAGCMRTKNVQAELDIADVWGIPEPFVKRDDQYLIPGDILISSANSWNLVGKCCWVPALPWRSTFGGFVSVLRADRAKVDPRFLFRWFAAERTQTTVRSFGQQTTNIANLNIERCLKLSLCVPPLAEQQRIATILDRADALRAKRRAALAQLDTLRQSIFLDMFGDPASNPKGWDDAKLGDLLADMQYGPRFYNEAYVSDGIRIARITDLDDAGRLDFEAMPRMSVTEGDTAQYALKSGDLIFARSGATVGKVGLFSAANPPCIPGAYFIRMRFKDVVAPEYALAVLTAKSIRTIIESQSRQSAQQNFSGPGLRRLPMPLPPISLQHQFARVGDAIAFQRQVHQRSLVELDALFGSLQHRAFRGKL